MGTESELCVDELLIKVRKSDELYQALATSSTKELVEEARILVGETQLYIDNHKSIIPSFILKQVSEALKRLESHINSSNKSKLNFKFKTKTRDNSCIKAPPDRLTVDTIKTTKTNIVSQDSFGFQRRSHENLSFDPEEVNSKDISLIELDSCTVFITGLANTVYIHNLKDTTVTICLACRAITVKDCKSCQFKFVCQQLRIDSTNECEFSVFTSARSMLEASKHLIFRELKLEDSPELKLTREQLLQLMSKAGFNRLENNWRCIDDFDWLSPDAPSKNYSLK